MTSLPTGQRFRVCGYSRHNSFTERLREMGLTRGAQFTVVRKAPFNGPVEIQIDNSTLVVRGADTALMLIEPA